jgi:serine/threonine-protein kinase
MLGDESSGGETLGEEGKLQAEPDAPSEELSDVGTSPLDGVGEGISGEEVSEEVAPDATAEVIQYGRYRLLNRIGKGGMAEVFLASMEGAQGFRRRCVVKRIRPDKAKSQYFAQMFVDEARITAALHHPNIVQVYEFGEIGNLYFLTMEYLDGKNLGSVLDALNARERLMAPAMATYIAQQVARGLHYAHALTDAEGRPLGVIHRDISPSNIMLLRTGEVKILDFGVAKAERALKEGATVVGKVKGKLSYMSPEQHSGDAIDQRADVFSVGVILWEMLTGEMLFGGPERRERSKRLLRGEPPPPSEVRRELPVALDAIVLKCLQLAPEDRYATAGELADDLGTAVRQALFDANDLVRLLNDVCGEFEQDATVVESAAAAAPAPPALHTPPPVGITPRRVVTREFGASQADEAATANFKRREPPTALIQRPGERWANVASALIVPVLAVAMALLPLAPHHTAPDPAELAAPSVLPATAIAPPPQLPASTPPPPAVPPTSPALTAEVPGTGASPEVPGTSAVPATSPEPPVPEAVLVPEPEVVAPARATGAARRPSVVDVGRTPARAKARPPSPRVSERVRPVRGTAKAAAPKRKTLEELPVAQTKKARPPVRRPELHVRDPFASKDYKLVDPF